MLKLLRSLNSARVIAYKNILYESILIILVNHSPKKILDSCIQLQHWFSIRLITRRGKGISLAKDIHVFLSSGLCPYSLVTLLRTSTSSIVQPTCHAANPTPTCTHCLSYLQLNKSMKRPGNEPCSVLCHLIDSSS